MQVTVVGIKFKQTGKIYFFDPKDIQLQVDDGVLVETARGLEYGIVATKNKEVDDSSIVSPLKPVIRKATQQDTKQYEENLQKAVEGQKAVFQMIEKLKLEMQVVDVEYVFDGSKVVISFTSDNRVDFRELVKDLAAKLKTRIELRQIGIRDKSKVVGGIGICGRECCCKKFLNDFEKVSIKMAKTQGLSLNPTKISGLCGRLMCCLEYENPFYNQVAQRMPKLTSEVITPDGKGIVVYQNLLKESVSVKIESSEGVFAYKEYKLDDLKFNRPKIENNQANNNNKKQKDVNKNSSQSNQQTNQQPNQQSDAKPNKSKKHKKFKKANDEKQSN